MRACHAVHRGPPERRPSSGSPLITLPVVQLTSLANELYLSLQRAEGAREQQAALAAHYQGQVAGLISLARVTAASLPASVENVHFFEKTVPLLRELLAGLGIKLVAC